MRSPRTVCYTYRMTDTHAARVGAEVRACMARLQRTQQHVADHLGVSQVAVSRRLSGAVPFTVTELADVATFLGVPITELLPADEVAASA